MERKRKEKKEWKEEREKRKKSQWTDFQYRWHPRQCRYPNNIRKENLSQVKGASAFHELRFLTSWSEKSAVTLLKSTHFDFRPRQRSWQALWHCLPEDAQRTTIFSALPSSAIDGVRALSHGTAEGQITQHTVRTSDYATADPQHLRTPLGAGRLQHFLHEMRKEGTAIIRILKVWNKLWTWWLSQYLGGRSRRLPMSLEPTCTT